MRSAAICIGEGGDIWLAVGDVSGDVGPDYDDGPHGSHHHNDPSEIHP